jgi:hypothetical protein
MTGRTPKPARRTGRTLVLPAPCMAPKGHARESGRHNGQTVKLQVRFVDVRSDAGHPPAASGKRRMWLTPVSQGRVMNRVLSNRVPYWCVGS